MHSLFAVLGVHAIAEYNRCTTRMDLIEVMQNLQSIAARQSDIEYDDVGTNPVNATDCVLSSLEFAAHDQAGDFTQHVSDAFTQRDRIFHENNFG